MAFENWGQLVAEHCDSSPVVTLAREDYLCVGSFFVAGRPWMDLMASEQKMAEVAFVLRPEWATVDLVHSSLGLQACAATPQADPTSCLLWTHVASGRD